MIRLPRLLSLVFDLALHDNIGLREFAVFESYLRVLDCYSILKPDPVLEM